MEMLDRCREEGVFRELVNKRAFIDKIVLAVWGTRRKTQTDALRVIANRGIAGPKSNYSRIVFAATQDGGNPTSLKYGLTVPKSIRQFFPPMQMALRSAGSPVTCAELLRAEEAMLCSRARHSVSNVELTFDTDRFRPTECLQTIFSKAKVTEQPSATRQTVYVGTPHSDWQLRIYEKTRSITRVEFILRSAALRRMEISRAEDLIRLRTAQLHDLVTWRQFRPVTTGFVLPHRPAYKKRALLSMTRRGAQGAEKLLRTQYGLQTALLLEPAPVASLLKHMQRRLVW
jgi:hypothetical protein